MNLQNILSAVMVSPSLVQEIDGWKNIHSLEFFRHQGQAEIRRQENKEYDDTDFVIANAAGSDLLSLVSTVDVMEIESVRYPITREGQYFDETDDLATVEELVSTFTNKTSGIAAAR